MKLKYYKRSAVISASCNETQASETKCPEACWSNYPAKGGGFRTRDIDETFLSVKRKIGKYRLHVNYYLHKIK